MEFTFSSINQPQLIDGGYLYSMQKDLANGALSWECIYRKRGICKARLKILNGEIIDRTNEHTHAPSRAKVEATKIKHAMKRRAETTLDPTHRIISDTLAEVTPTAAINLPRIENIRRNIRRYRESHNLPANPNNRADIPEIPQNLRETSDGQNFLLYDNGVGDVNRILIFATERGTNLLKQSDHWFGDGTFKVSPVIFFQVYTIHAVCNGKVFPCIFALLPNKTVATYELFFREIERHMDGHTPRDILFDFEQAALNSVRNIFPDVNVKGCFFHLSKNIWKRIVNNGLKVFYVENNEFEIQMRMVSALAFIPVDEVLNSFYDLEIFIRDNFDGVVGVDDVLDYFEDNYIGRQRRGRPRAIPPFPIELWNMFDRTQEELPRTNNSIEGWHHRFSLNCDGMHPSLWKFIDALKREEGFIRADLHQVLGGHPVTHKKKYVDCAQRIKNIVDNHNL